MKTIKSRRPKQATSKLTHNARIYKNFLMIIYGLNHHGKETHVCGKVWSYFIQLNMVVLLLFKIGVMTHHCVKKWDSIVDLIDFHVVWQTISCLILYLNFVVYGKTMAKMSTKFRNYVPLGYDEPHLWSIPFVMVYVAQLLVDFVVLKYLEVIHSSFKDQEEFFFMPHNHFLEIIRTFIRLMYTNAWTFTTYLIYIVHIYRFHDVNRIFFDYMIHEFSAQQLRVKWFHVQQTRLLDQNILSLLPFIWTMNVFFRSFVNAVGSKVRRGVNSNPIDLILQYVIMSKDVTMILIVIFFIDWVNHQARLRLDKLKGKVLMMSLKNSNEVEHLLQEMSDSVEFVATGWSMFTLNKTFILSFLSALISFSVLFMQLTAN